MWKIRKSCGNKTAFKKHRSIETVFKKLYGSITALRKHDGISGNHHRSKTMHTDKNRGNKLAMEIIAGVKRSSKHIKGVIRPLENISVEKGPLKTLRG